MPNASTGPYQKRLWTIPNILSFFRLCLIPAIVWLYVGKKDYLRTLIIVLLSALTDIADGIIARAWNMTSDFGKALDPIADKLTQIATLFCLVSRFHYMIVPLALLIVKEVCTGITSLVSMKRTGTVKSAVWHGKLTTVSLYTMMAMHIIWYNVPHAVSLMAVGVCIGMMLMSFILYSIRNIKAIHSGSFE